jgi:hypothetical protein
MTSNDEQRAADLEAVAEARIGELQATIAQAWSILTGWDAVRLKNGSHTASADPAAALLEACSALVRERNQLRTLASQQRDEIERLNCLADAVECLRDIGRQTGCDHVDDPDGRRKLVNCVEETIAKAEAERDEARRLLGEVEMGVGHVVAAAINDFRAWALETRVLRNKTRGWKDALIGKLLDILNARFSNQAAARAEPGRE